VAGGPVLEGQGGSGGQQRVLEAALDLFAEHGVSGTSLQMIADRMGVTKAAVYHQFRTKEEIVFAVIDPDLAGLSDDELRRQLFDAASRLLQPAVRPLPPRRPPSPR
jgi:AcrR family transcriptional regulator